MPTESRPLLTIAIPTYNRQQYLDRCLAQIVKQSDRYGGKVELIVSDNCSPDDTEAVVNSYIADGHKIQYIRNDKNIGPDANFRQCFEVAAGKYFLLFSDDDLLLDGSLDKVMRLLESDEFGVIHLKSYFFMSDYLKELPKRKIRGALVFDDINMFIKKIHVLFTYISGNVVNKSLVSPDLNLDDFAETNMLQLSWTFSSLFNSAKNVYYDEYLVAGQSANTGGYRFCEVFGKNTNTVFRIFIDKYGIDSNYFNIIVRKLIRTDLSKYILLARKGFNDRFYQEDFLGVLSPIYKSHLGYWIYIYPAVKWPLPLAKVWCKVCRFFAKLYVLRNYL